MKIRLGIREKFALVAFGLVLAGALALPLFLLKGAQSVVEEHEVEDLRDEADLRCWEIIDSQNQLRRHLNDYTKDKEGVLKLSALLKSLERLEKPAPESLAEFGVEDWQSYVISIKQFLDESEPQTLYSSPSAPTDIHPPQGAVKAALEQSNNYVTLSRIGFLDVPLGFLPLLKNPAMPGDRRSAQRIPLIWCVSRYKKDSGRGGALAICVSLQRVQTPEHLQFVLDDSQFLMHPALNENGQPQAIYATTSTNGTQEEMDLFGECKRLTHIKSGWGNGQIQADAQTQPADGSPLPRTLIHPYYFLEGRQKSASSFVKGVGDDLWAKDFSLKLARSGIQFSTADRVRLLATTKRDLDRGREQVETAFSEKLGKGAGGLAWNPPVTLRRAHVQLMRFSLRFPSQYGEGLQTPVDPNYYLAYGAFPEEFASSVGHEMRGLWWRAGGLALAAGFVAFMIAFRSIRPLARIADTAKAVATPSSETLELQNQIETVRGALPIGRDDEVGDIAHALENLLRQVLNGHERLRQLNADLDTRVRDQTMELRGAAEQLRGLATAKDAFLASVSHELRQPLNSIFGFLHFLEMSNIDDEQRRDLNRLRGAATYLKRLIDDILDYQKIIIGGVELDPEEFDAAEFLLGVRDFIAPAAEEKKNRLEMRGVESLGTIRNDRSRLQQVLVNLLSNACKFTESGTVGLGASIETDSGGRKWLRVEVSDTGRGMKEEELNDLFVRFKKLSAREGNKTGTGLGLVISKGIVDLMGGSIQCVSVAGKGTTFTVRIPAAVGVLAPELPGAAPMPVPAPVSNSRPTVLVIDDDSAVRELMLRFLYSKGYEVIAANDGESGIALAKERRPSVITLDVILPGGQTGWDVLGQLKADPATEDIPVIMITFLEESRRGFALGATDYLVKPIAWGRLLDSLRRITGFAPLSSPILVVDDEDDMRGLYRRTLVDAGLAVVEARNGAEALEQLRLFTPSIVLLDLTMPVMDGFQFIAEVKRHPEWHNIPIVVVTAKSPTREEREQLAGSIRAFIEKDDTTHEQLLNNVLGMLAQCAPAK